MMNKMGPRHDPCATPQSILKRSERDPSMETRRPSLGRYNLNIPYNALIRSESIQMLIFLNITTKETSLTKCLYLNVVCVL